MAKPFIKDREFCPAKNRTVYEKEVDLGYVQCCGAMRKSRTFALVPEKGYLVAQADYVEVCPACGHTILILTRIDTNNKVSIYRTINKKAKKFFLNLKHSILFEKYKIINPFTKQSGFYLYYNEFGRKKKCYSNLSTLKLGKFEDKFIPTIHKLS